MEQDDTACGLAQAGQDARRGTALILAIVLVGAIVTLTMSAQMSMAVMLKQAHIRQTRTMLRIAASDAALYVANRAAAKPGSGVAPDQAVTPSGIRTEVQTRALGKTEASFLPVARNELAGDPKFVLIESKAAISGAVEQVTCLVAKDTGGVTRVVGWLENR